MNDTDYHNLEARIGRLHLKQRLGIERDNETRVFGQGLNFFHIENWYSLHSIIKNGLKFTAMYGRGRRNALDIRIEHHEVPISALPDELNGFTILQLSDVHLDMNEHIPAAIIKQLNKVKYDTCVITGDFRAATYGSSDAVLQAMAEIRPHIESPIYAILGNHDSISMVPGLENIGVRVLLNENVVVEKGPHKIYLSGLDDPHYYCVDNIDRAAWDIPPEAVSILLSHTPEIYKRAAHSDFNLMLCGHTHGGQICLPGGFPLMTNARCHRRYCSGSWNYHNMIGYTSRGTGVSVVDVRFNCTPEITLHHLRAA